MRVWKPWHKIFSHPVFRYLATAGIGNLVWETAQLPLYTIWRSKSWQYLAFAVLHCTLGDMLIAAVCLGLALLATGRNGLTAKPRRTAAISIPLGVVYTIFSEWLHVSVRQSWAYAAAMPIVPGLGTGLSPFLQWLVVPAIAIWIASKERSKLV